MNVLRSILFDNLGLKLVALLLAVVVYLNVYTDRPATMIVSFPITVSDIADTLSLSGPAPASVQVELRGTGKQLIRLRVAEPPIKISLAGVGAGRYERAVSPSDLPLPEGDQIGVDRIVSPRTIELTVEPKRARLVAVAARLEGAPGTGAALSGQVELHPAHVRVTGPQSEVAKLDTVWLEPVGIGGHRDTVHVRASAADLPEWCTMDPDRVEVAVPIEPAITRRMPVPVEAPREMVGYAASPRDVTLVVTGPRTRVRAARLAGLKVRWVAPPAGGALGGRLVPVRLEGASPEGLRIRFEPDSVTLERVRS